MKKLEPMVFSENIYKMSGISKKTVEEHMKLYQGYVTKYNEIMEQLGQLTDEDYTKGNQVYSKIRELKVELTFAWGGVINHEIYFAHLGGKGGQPTGKLMEQIKKDFGSYENYVKDVKATGISARGWVWTAWHHREGRLFNFLGDAQNTFPVWGAKPIMALDTYEHAYFIDFGTARAGYIDAFFNNIDWKVVEKNFHSMVGCDCENCLSQGDHGCCGNCDCDKC